MKELAERMKNVQESQTIAMAKKARALAAEGIDVINLSFGEPDFPTPQHICTAAIQAIHDGYTKYTPVAGIPELRKAISEKFLRENGLQYSPEQIVVSTGAKHSIMNVVMCLVNPGDEVIIPTPYWVSYGEMVKLAGGIPVFVEGKVENDFIPDLKDIAALVNSKTKLIIFSSPCNPTGSVFEEDFLNGLKNIILSHEQIYVVSDEIYEHIRYEGTHTSFAAIDGMYERVITVNGLSKGYAMTGWRIGYIGAPQWISTACEILQGQFTSGTNSIAQRAALAALNGDQSPTREMREAFQKRRDLIIEGLAQIPGMRCSIPKGAFYVFPNIEAFFGKRFQHHTIANSSDLSMFLLEQAHVSVVPGSAFGDDRCIRISFATSDALITESMQRIKRALNLLHE